MAEQATDQIPDVEFTHRWYRQFLQGLRAAGYEFRQFTEPVGDREIVLRHDVDLSIEAAVEMARLESDLDIRSTYCVLLSSPLYNPFEGQHRDAIREIDSLGHDVALHFDAHQHWPDGTRPDAGAIERRVEEERVILETIVPRTRTVSFHRPPEWLLDRAFDGFRSTYEPRYFSDMEYVADSNQRWRDDPPAPDRLPETFQLLTHPGLWGAEDVAFDRRVQMAVTDACNHADRTAHSEFIDGDPN